MSYIHISVIYNINTYIYIRHIVYKIDINTYHVIYVYVYNI